MDPVLYRCIGEGDIKKLKEIASSDLLLTQTTYGNNTALHVAVQYGRKVIVKEIYNSCTSLLLHQNLKGDTALHMASRAGLTDIVEFLINVRRDEDVESGGSGEHIPNQELLRMGNNTQNTALHEAVRYDHVKVVKLLTRADPTFTYFANNAHETPLYLAAEKGWYDIVAQILDTCSSPAHGGPNGRNALHAATIRNDFGIMKILLEKQKFLIKVGDDKGWNALHHAVYHDFHERVVQLLEVDKTIVCVPANDGRTALHIAATEGSLISIEHIIRFCPDCWELVDSKGQNFLHTATRFGHQKLVRHILKTYRMVEGLLNDVDNDGNTPLHLAALAGEYLIEAMLEHDDRVKRSITNNLNLTAEEIIIKTEHPFSFLIYRKVGDMLIAHLNPRLESVASFRGFFYKFKETLEIIMPGVSIWSSTRNRHSYKQIVQEEVEAKDDFWFDLKERKDISNIQLLVAALIATVTFAAGITLPGGFKDDGENEGMATLTRVTTFRAFVISNTIAMLLSLSAIFVHFQMSLAKNVKTINLLFGHATTYILAALIAMAVAFLTGSYAVLSNAHGLATTVVVICCCIFYVFLVILTHS
ncbi:hypothetical protein ACHQM5_018754 [Ranunculus cassubicifolius]